MIESGIWDQVIAKLKWHMQMFIDFYGFLHWKSCLIKNNIATKLWVQKAQIM